MTAKRALSEDLRLKKARQVRPNVRVLLTGILDPNEVVHFEFLLEGQTYFPDFFVFPKLKRYKKEQRYATIKEVKISSIKNSKLYQKAYSNIV